MTNYKTAEQQYLEIGQKILDEGVWMENKRTNTRCLTLINEKIEIDVSKGDFPILTTKKSYWQQAIGEILGYVRGYTKTEEFHQLGVRTWDANASNPNWTESVDRDRLGEHDLGIIYGAVGNRPLKIDAYVNKESGHVEYEVVGKLRNTLSMIIEDLILRNDNRGLIWNFWNPGLQHNGCLRPCVYQHHFSLLGDTLHLTSYARSQDYSTGTPFNLIQCYWLLDTVAKITNLKPGKVHYHMINVHLYEDHVDLFKEQLTREPYLTSKPTLTYVGERPMSFNYIMREMDPRRDYQLANYVHHAPIKYPFHA